MTPIGHIHIISDRFSFRITELCGMMWTHFPFYIYVEYKFKSFQHYFILMCFDGKYNHLKKMQEKVQQ